MRDGPKAGLRMTSAVRRKAGTTRDEFRRHWADVHAPLALAHPEVFGISRYVQLTAPDDAEAYPPAVATVHPTVRRAGGGTPRRCSPTPTRRSGSRRDPADTESFIDRAARAAPGAST